MTNYAVHDNINQLTLLLKEPPKRSDYIRNSESSPGSNWSPYHTPTLLHDQQGSRQILIITHAVV